MKHKQIVPLPFPLRPCAACGHASAALGLVAGFWDSAAELEDVALGGFELNVWLLHALLPVLHDHTAHSIPLKHTSYARTIAAAAAAPGIAASRCLQGRACLVPSWRTLLRSPCV